MNKKLFLILFLLLIAGLFINQFIHKKPTDTSLFLRKENANIISGSLDDKKLKTEEEWRKLLSPEEFHILREAGTETPFTGKLEYEKRVGTYYSVGCNTPLFRSEKKYDSGTGWPSFWATIKPDSVVLRKESDGRIEVLDTCGGHLGHMFDDGPPPTGKRYCMNSVALRFVPDKNQ